MAQQPLVPARVLRRAVAVSATVVAAFVTHASGAPVPVVPAQSGLTEPGAIVRSPDDALWTTWPEMGVCRISPGAAPRPIEGTYCGDELRQGPKEPLGMAFDRRSPELLRRRRRRGLRGRVADALEPGDGHDRRRRPHRPSGRGSRDRPGARADGTDRQRRQARQRGVPDDEGLHRGAADRGPAGRGRRAGRRRSTRAAPAPPPWPSWTATSTSPRTSSPTTTIPPSRRRSSRRTS